MTGTDSSGHAWEGRSLPPTPFAGDDGRPDAELAAALDAARQAPSPDLDAAVALAFAAARVFAPVVAMGDEHESGAQMALVTLTGRDGRRLLPAFTTVESLSAWRPDARPVPIRGRDLAGAARAEGCELVGLDVGTQPAFVLRRPAVDAVAAGQAWQPAVADPAVRAAIVAVAAGVDAVCRIEAGADLGRDEELVITVGLPPGLTGEQVGARMRQVQGGLAADPVVATRVDSLALLARAR